MGLRRSWPGRVAQGGSTQYVRVVSIAMRGWLRLELAPDEGMRRYGYIR